MNGLPYYKAYPRDFIEGTIGMPLELKGAYRIVIDLIYLHGGKLPDDTRYISGVLGCTTWKWVSLRKQLLAAGKIQLEDDCFTNGRAKVELKLLDLFQTKQRENASKPRKNNDLQKPRLSHTEPDIDIERGDANASLAHDNVRRTEKQAEAEFQIWYERYPLKRGKGQAERAFRAARKIASLQDLLDGVDRYRRDKLSDRAWRYPATWLNGKGWLDEPELPLPVRQNGPAPPAEPSIDEQIAEFIRKDKKHASG